MKRRLLMAVLFVASALAGAPAGAAEAVVKVDRAPNGVILDLASGRLQLAVCSERAVRVTFTPPGAAPLRPSLVVVKPCDSRDLNVLLAETQIERERAYVIGVACDGIVRGSGFAPQLAISNRQSAIQDRCLRCGERMPVVYDVLVGEPPQVNIQDDYADVAKLEAMMPAERVAFWLKQYERCIRCYACRQVCPGCYCNVCMFERDDSLWGGISTGVKEKEFFHLGRAYHLAARCVECNECERVCPMELPLSLLNRKLAKEVLELFRYRAGVEPVKAPLLTMLAEGEEPLI